MLQALKIRLLIYSHLLQSGSTVIKLDSDGFSWVGGSGFNWKSSILKHTRVFYSLVLNMKGLYLLLLQYFLHVPDLITLSNETCNQNRNFKLERYKNITVNWRDIIVAVIYQHILSIIFYIKWIHIFEPMLLNSLKGIKRSLLY